MKKELFIPNTLIESARNGRLVFFVGAGFSKDFGYPDWKGLVEIMLNKIIKDDPNYKPFLDLLNNGKMEVLDILEHIKKEKRIIRDTIYEEFKFDTSKKALLDKHKKLISISRKIITTNYDQLLENAADGTIQKVVYTNSHLIAQISNLDSFILKIHGDHEEADKCILLKEDYEKLYNSDNSALEQFKNIITNNTVLFIGFSLSDPYISHLFGYINKLYEGYQEKNYILTINNEDFSEYNVTNIKLETYDDIVPFLEALSEEVKKKDEESNFDNLEIDEDEFKSFIIEFNKKKRKTNDVGLNQEDIEEKYKKMVCSDTFKKEIEEYSAYFPSIDEIMMSPSYIDFDKNTIITSIIISAYNKVHNKYDNGELIFEATVDEIYKEYHSEFSYSKSKLKLYIKILVAWTIIGCDIFNEDKRKVGA